MSHMARVYERVPRRHDHSLARVSVTSRVQDTRKLAINVAPLAQCCDDRASALILDWIIESHIAGDEWTVLMISQLGLSLSSIIPDDRGPFQAEALVLLREVRAVAKQAVQIRGPCLHMLVESFVDKSCVVVFFRNVRIVLNEKVSNLIVAIIPVVSTILDV